MAISDLVVPKAYKLKMKDIKLSYNEDIPLSYPVSTLYIDESTKRTIFKDDCGYEHDVEEMAKKNRPDPYLGKIYRDDKKMVKRQVESKETLLDMNGIETYK
jgi:hypothetical protein